MKWPIRGWTTSAKILTNDTIPGPGRHCNCLLCISNGLDSKESLDPLGAFRFLWSLQLTCLGYMNLGNLLTRLASETDPVPRTIFSLCARRLPAAPCQIVPGGRATWQSLKCFGPLTSALPSAQNGITAETLWKDDLLLAGEFKIEKDSISTPMRDNGKFK
jgi:hypothetical protein